MSVLLLNAQRDERSAEEKNDGFNLTSDFSLKIN